MCNWWDTLSFKQYLSCFLLQVCELWLCDCSMRCQCLLQMAMFHHKRKTALMYSKTLTDHFHVSNKRFRLFCFFYHHICHFSFFKKNIITKYSLAEFYPRTTQSSCVFIKVSHLLSKLIATAIQLSYVSKNLSSLLFLPQDHRKPVPQYPIAFQQLRSRLQPQCQWVRRGPSGPHRDSSSRDRTSGLHVRQHHDVILKRSWFLGAGGGAGTQRQR